jgi:prepilin-type N-terminal cleavage/methylation domain-containing protein
MSKHAKQQGFSLLELILALALSVGLMGTVFYYLKQNQDSFVVEAAIADLHQNFRAAMDLMTRDIQAAGSGLPQFLGPLAGLDGGTDPDTGNPLTDTSGRPLTDEILILYGDPSFPALTVTNGPIASRTSTIQVQNPPTGPAPTFTNGDNYILYAVSQPNAYGTADMAEFDVFTLSSQTAVTGGVQLVGTASTAVNPPAWGNLAFPSVSALRVARLSEWVRYRVDPTTNELQRSISGGAWVAVARNITNLQVQYWVESVDPGTGAVTQNYIDQVGTDATNNRALTRSVRFTLTGQSQMTRVADGQGQRTLSQTIEVTPRNLVLPGFVLNR